MSNHSKHRVIFFELDALGAPVWDHNDQMVVSHIRECESLSEAQRVHRESVLATGVFFATKLSVAVEAFGETQLADYLHALNTEARLAEEFPKEGLWISGLTEDLTHWDEIGVKTPADLAAYLDGCFEREMQKAAMAA